MLEQIGQIVIGRGAHEDMVRGWREVIAAPQSPKGAADEGR